MTDSSNSVKSGPELEEEEREGEAAAAEVIRIVSPPPGCSPTAAAYRSVCTSSTAAKYAITYKVPSEYGLCAPRSEERAHAPPPGYATVYTHHFGFGLRLPLQPFLASVLAHYQIALAQLSPKSIISVLGFVEVCKGASVIPTLTLFRHFYNLRENCSQTEGWYAFHAMPPKIVHKQASGGGVNRWRTSFLFFKTAPLPENLNLSWNYCPVMEPPVVGGRPSEPTIIKILACVESSFKSNPLEQVEKMSEADTTTAFAPKSSSSKNGIMKAAGEVQAKKSSLENETCSQKSPAARASNATSESACRLERLKRTAELDATKPAKTLRGATGKKHVDESSQVLSVSILKDMTLDQIASYSQKCFCSLHSQLQGDKEELEKVVDLLKTEVSRLQRVEEQYLKDRENKIAELEKENASLRAEVSRLRSVSDDPGPILKVLETVIAAKEQEAKLKNEEIGSLKSQLDDRGPLLRVYTRKLLETQAFGRLFYDLTTSAQRLGRHEAAEQIQDRFPAIPEDALVGLEDPLAAVQLENLLCDMVQDDAFKFPLLDHLLSLPEIPTSSQLKHFKVDEDRGSLIAPPPLCVKLEEPAMG